MMKSLELKSLIEMDHLLDALKHCNEHCPKFGDYQELLDIQERLEKLMME